MTGPVLRRDAAHNRQLLLDAAAEVFAVEGLAATLDDVAHRAGVGVGTAYRRFANKQELIEALFEARITSLGALADDALACEDPFTGLRQLLTQTMEQMAGDRGLKDVLMFGIGEPGIVRIQQRVGPPVEKLLARAQAIGQVRPDVAAGDIAAMFWMLGTVADYCAEVDPEQWRRQLSLILDGMCTKGEPLSGAALSPELQAQAIRKVAACLPGRRRRPADPTS